MLDLISNESDTVPKSKVEYLVKSETADEVEKNLENGILDWIDDSRYTWEKLGGMANNRVLAEMTDGLTGIVENITNAGDAYLLQNYDGEGDFSNSHRAADELLSGEEEVVVRFDGNKGRGGGDTDFSVSISDEAHGQPQDNFSVFVDPLESGVSKTEFGFLQGCRGVGGMTALAHAKNGYKFIASAPDSNETIWTWTIIREDDDGDFEYLKIDGDFPVFEGEFDCGEGIGIKTQGTVVKLYSYSLQSNPDNAAKGTVFRRRLSRRLVRPVTDIRISDVRYGDDYIYSGIHREVDKHDNSFIEPIQIESSVHGLGDILIDVFIAEDKETRENLYERGKIPEEHAGHMTQFFTSSNESRVLVSVNGQVQSTYSKADLKSCGDVSTVSDEMIVVVRCVENSKNVSSDVFNTARNGFSDESVESRLSNTVFGSIRNHDKIQEIDHNRSQKYEEASTVSIPESMNVVQDVVNLDVDGTADITLSFDTDTEFMDSCNTEFDMPSSLFDVKSANSDGNNVNITVHATEDAEVGNSEECKVFVTVDGTPLVGSFSVEVVDRNNVENEKLTIRTKVQNEPDVPEDTSILDSVLEFANLDSNVIEDNFDSMNPQNMMGEPAEAFMKNLICKATDDSVDARRARQNCLSWGGSKNHPPDAIIENGSAVEIKHQSTTGKIPLNSSPPRQKISASDDMISRECSNCEDDEWNKDVFYSIINTDNNNKIDEIWVVQGSCINAPSEYYEQVANSIKDTVANQTLNGGELSSDTSEIARVNGIDELSSTNLRVRGMFSMKHPREHFEEFIAEPKSDDSQMFTVMTQEKFREMPQETKNKILDHDEINIQNIKVQNPADEREKVEAILIEI